MKTGGLFSHNLLSCVDIGKSYASTAINNSSNGKEDNMIMDYVNDMISCNDFNNGYSDSVPDIADVLNGVDSDLDNMLQCEIFTDFSDLLLETNEQSHKLIFEDAQAPLSATKRSKTTKRTAAEVFAGTDEIVSTTKVNADHTYNVLPINEQSSKLEDDIKHIRYLERRRKNNAASKRSREMKKSRMVEMEQQAVLVEENNERLRERIVDLDRLTKLMKSMLVKRVSLGAE